MARPGRRNDLRPRFWERVPLSQMTAEEWEALCDGCGKCCLNKLEDEETGQVEFTRIACRLLDDDTCRCTHYDIRHQFVPDCVTLRPETIADNAYWMPRSCAYRRLAEGKPLPGWHYLLSGDPESVHDAGISVRGMTLSEFDIPEDEWEDHLIEIET
ncbi:YcgN family cysteine cluster protein [Tropicimonas sp. IMCC6043]|uniref:YcgN family cysteine cluster protein n=1 Tax=Tropicimonas sp. IMCC6043 TaxID=2510645 RepID=UPI00101D6EE0|nr:YcgN family cysteine cluster protein [Tropicimonas sp. IMCC6043]RYH08098.1 YcgN family cysteine cluster protein [Tropicimonas sp. IMCC6043]